MSYGYVIHRQTAVGPGVPIAAVWTGSGHIKYQAPGGTFHEMKVQPAWCRECAEFVFAEAVITAEQVAADARSHFIARHGQPDTEFSRDALACHLRDALHRYEFAISTMARRQSGPRCLNCGSHSIQPIAAAPTPQCQYFAVPVLGDAANAFAGIYSAEGERLR